MDFWWTSGPHFDSFSGTLNQNRCFFSCLFPGHFAKRFSGSESGRLVFKKQAFGVRGLQKPTFHRSWNSVVLRVHFCCFWVALGPILMTFDALETGLKFDEFS